MKKTIKFLSQLKLNLWPLVLTANESKLLRNEQEITLNFRVPICSINVLPLSNWNVKHIWRFFFHWIIIVKDSEWYFCYNLLYVKSLCRFKRFKLHQRWWFFSSLRPLCVFKCVWDISIRNIFQFFFGLVWSEYETFRDLSIPFCFYLTLDSHFSRLTSNSITSPQQNKIFDSLEKKSIASWQ